MQRARSAACEELSARGARVADEEQLGVDVDGGRGVEAGDGQRAQPDLGAASGDQGIDALRGLPGRRVAGDGGAAGVVAVEAPAVVDVDLVPREGAEGQAELGADARGGVGTGVGRVARVDVEVVATSAVQ
jgi:hypothetical protein